MGQEPLGDTLAARQRPDAVLRGKLRMHCMLLVPLSAVCVLALARCSWAAASPALLLAAAICGGVFGWFVGVAGLVCNLLSPRFDWINGRAPASSPRPCF